VSSRSRPRDVKTRSATEERRLRGHDFEHYAWWMVIAALAGLLAALVTPQWAWAAQPHPSSPGDVRVRVVLYERPDCAHCAAASMWLDAWARAHPAAHIDRFDVERDAAARAELAAIVRRERLAAVTVPVVIAERGEQQWVFVGFDRPETTGRRIEAWLDERASSRTAAPGSPSDRGDESDSAPQCLLEQCPPAGDAAGERITEPDRVELPLLGPVDVHAMGLPVFTIVVGLIDGFNPCAMWVLLFLLALLVNVRSRARMLAVAGVFVLVSGIAYFAFMAAWLETFVLLGLARPAQIALGVFGIAAGAIHLKDAIWPGHGPSLSIPESAKPSIYARARAIVRAEHLGSALAGATVLAVVVNVVEMLCTAGLPALYTHVLSRQGLSRPAHYAYLALYDAAYMADDALMVGIAVVTMQKRKLQERGARILQLVSGVVVVALGLALIARPQWLSWTWAKAGDGPCSGSELA
jgi:hypothetical protein